MLAGFFTVLTVSAVLVGLASIISIMTISSMSAERKDLQKTNHSIVVVLTKHYSWLQSLTESVITHSPFDGSLDPNTCALGDFLNSPEAKNITDPEIISLLNSVKEPHNFIHLHAQDIKELIADKQYQEAEDLLLQEIIGKTHETITILNKISERYETLAEEKDNEMTSVENKIVFSVILMLIISVAVGAALSIILPGGIEKSLRAIIEKLSASVTHITSSSVQLNEAVESLAEGSSKNAAAIQETSATMNQTSSIVQQTTENTRVASQIATTCLSEVNEAGEVMVSLMATMDELKDSSDKVNKIVKTIDNIAFQTNLLAINATVEAARAGGDAGRSFAVVAQEVRSLAQKSADASKETAEIIEKNITLTNSSRVGAERVGEIARGNAVGVANLEKLIAEINTASEEQASGIKQIDIAMGQMGRVTQENAAVAEENAAASNSMRDEIANLEDAVSIAKSLIRNGRG